jgi:hypothetical protein
MNRLLKSASMPLSAMSPPCRIPDRGAQRKQRILIAVLVRLRCVEHDLDFFPGETIKLLFRGRK